jgi:hypothetical protein
MATPRSQETCVTVRLPRRDAARLSEIAGGRPAGEFLAELVAPMLVPDDDLAWVLVVISRDAKAYMARRYGDAADAMMDQFLGDAIDRDRDRNKKS